MKRLLGTILMLGILGALGFAALFVLENRSNLRTLVETSSDYLAGREIDAEAVQEASAQSIEAAKQKSQDLQAGLSDVKDSAPKGYARGVLVKGLRNNKQLSDGAKVMVAQSMGIEPHEIGISDERLLELSGHKPKVIGTFQERILPLPVNKTPTTQYTTPASIKKSSLLIQANGEAVTSGIRSIRVIPSATASTTASPVVLLFHGAGRDAGSMLDVMSKAPSARNFTLISAQSANDQGWGGAVTGNTVSAILALLPKNISVDTSRVYAFGHSAGAQYAGLLAAMSNGSLQAVAAHGGVLDLDKIASAPLTVPEPMRFYIGDQEQSAPYPAVKPKIMKHTERGHNVELIVVRNHTHWFYDRGFILCEDALRWFSSLG